MTGQEHPTERFWSCLVCADGVKHEIRSSLSAHIQEKHEQFVSPDQIPTLLDACLQTPSNADFSCPLCPCDRTEDTRFSLEHIAEHLHSFALLSLPWAPDAAVVNTAARQEANTKVIPWLGLEHDSSTQSLPTAHVAENSTIDEASLYFANEAYFAENKSMRSSSSSAPTDTDRDLEGFDAEGSLVFGETEIEIPGGVPRSPQKAHSPWFDGSVDPDVSNAPNTSQFQLRTSVEPVYPVHPFPPELTERISRLPIGIVNLALNNLICMQLIERIALDEKQVVALVSRTSILEDLEDSSALRQKLTMLERLIWIATSFFHRDIVSAAPEEKIHSSSIGPFFKRFLECSQRMIECSQAENECLLWCGCTVALTSHLARWELSRQRIILDILLSRYKITVNEMNAIAKKFFWDDSLAARFATLVEGHNAGVSQGSRQYLSESSSLSEANDEAFSALEDEVLDQSSIPHEPLRKRQYSYEKQYGPSPGSATSASSKVVRMASDRLFGAAKMALVPSSVQIPKWLNKDKTGTFFLSAVNTH